MKNGRIGLSGGIYNIPRYMGVAQADIGALKQSPLMQTTIALVILTVYIDTA